MEKGREGKQSDNFDWNCSLRRGDLFQSSTHRPFVQRSRYSILDWNYNHHDKGLIKRRSSISYVRDKFDVFGAACIAPEPYASDTLSADAQRQIYVAPGGVSRTRIPLYSATSSSFSPLFSPTRFSLSFLSPSFWKSSSTRNTSAGLKIADFSYAIAPGNVSEWLVCKLFIN